MQWSEVLCCSLCTNVFGEDSAPISLSCGHVMCRPCLGQLRIEQCPTDQTPFTVSRHNLPVNLCLLEILHIRPSNSEKHLVRNVVGNDGDVLCYESAVGHLVHMAGYLHRAQSERGGSVWSAEISRPMQRKLVSLICFQLLESEGRCRAIKVARSLSERSLTELLLMHQNSSHLSSNLWSAVRARGCQFLGPAMQEEVLKLILLTLSEGASISRKTLVMYIVQTLEKDYPQASKTCVGHVVQLLYRASCFNVIKRDGESSLMQLKEEYRNYESLRREHDVQIVQIAMEAGLRISPDQWSSLLYGDQTHRSHLQSIIDKLQSPQGFGQSIQELVIALQRSGDPDSLMSLVSHLELLSSIDPTPADHSSVPSWSSLDAILFSCRTVIDAQVNFCRNRVRRDSSSQLPSLPEEEPVPGPSSAQYYRYKTNMCRDVLGGRACPRGSNCTFAHSVVEMQTHRAKNRQPPRLAQRPGRTNDPRSPLEDTIRPLPTPVLPSIKLLPQSGHESLAVSPCPIQVVPEQAVMAPQNPTLIVPGPVHVLQSGQVIANASARPVMQQGLQVLTTPQNVTLIQSDPYSTGWPMAYVADFQAFNPPGGGFSSHYEKQIEANQQRLNQLRSKRDEIVRRLGELRGGGDNNWWSDDMLNDAKDMLHYTMSTSVAPGAYPKPRSPTPQPQYSPWSQNDDNLWPWKSFVPWYFEPDFEQQKSSDPSWLREMTFDHPGGNIPSSENRQQNKMWDGNHTSLAWQLSVNTVKPGGTVPTSQTNTTTVQAAITQVKVKDCLSQPIATAHVQGNQAGPIVSYESVDPGQIAWNLPKVIKSAQSVFTSEAVSDKLDKIVCVKEKLTDVDNPAVVRQHLTMELNIINRQIDNLDKQTEEVCLLKELESVDESIDNVKNSIQNLGIG